MGACSIRFTGLEAHCEGWEVTNIWHYASQDILIGPHVGIALEIDIVFLVAARCREIIRIRGRDEDRDCASRIDNAKPMTLPTFSSHVHMLEKLSRLHSNASARQRELTVTIA
jgi:hypothetical protein